MRLFKVLLYSLIFSYSSLFSAVYFQQTNAGSINSTSCESGQAYLLENYYSETVQTSYKSICADGLGGHEDDYATATRKQIYFRFTYCLGETKTYWKTGFENICTWHPKPDDYCPSGEYFNVNTGVCTSLPSCGVGMVWDSVSQTCIPTDNLDDDGDGIPNKCDKDHPDYDSLDCDDDGLSNSDPLENDVDGDDIPNDYDLDNEVPTDSEGSPTCEEMRQISESKCSYNHQFECVHGPPAYTIKDLCLQPRSPCENEIEKLKRNCDLSTYQLQGNCYDNGLDITANTLKCVAKPDLPPDCDRSWHEVLNTSTNECECENGYEYNGFGDCWKSSIDSNSTDDEIAEDERQQDLNNEAKTEEEEEKKQQQKDNNSSSSSLTLDNSRNDTLKGIREDLNTTNSLLSGMNDKLDNDGNGTSNDDRRDGLLSDIKDLLFDMNSSMSDNNVSSSLDFLSDSVGAILNKYTVDLTQGGGCGSISTVGGVILGQNVVFLSQDIINQMPIEYMRNIIVFLFTISALILVFRGV